YTLLLFLLEYRAATLLIKTQFPGPTAASITKIELDGDVISLDGHDVPLRTDGVQNRQPRPHLRPNSALYFLSTGIRILKLRHRRYSKALQSLQRRHLLHKHSHPSARVTRRHRRRRVRLVQCAFTAADAAGVEFQRGGEEHAGVGEVSWKMAVGRETRMQRHWYV
ncbi:hypothetical protein S83_020471, partial [Arachis hypogaea]